MIISLLIILLLSLSGLSLTYLFSKKETFLWRLSAGNIIGSAFFGLVCFIIANFFGLSAITILVSLAISIAPLLIIIKNKEAKKQLKLEWQEGKNKCQGANFAKFWHIAYYIFFIALFIAFFDRAMIVKSTGIFTGTSHNLGDLPYHLGAIFSFADGNNFPPQNPSYAGSKFTYPFMTDFLTACLIKLDVRVQTAMLVQNVSLAFSLLVILERFVFKIAGKRLAGKIAPFILFFNGGFGFLWFFKDYFYGTSGVFELLWNLPQDYTIGDEFRWGNSLVTLFITQRSLLFGMPLTVIILEYLWKIFRIEKVPKKRCDNKKRMQSARQTFDLSGFLIGLLAGTLPLIHTHSLLVLFIVSTFLFFFSMKNWKGWMSFGFGVLTIAVPELLWILHGSAANTREFIDWHFGWDNRQDNIIWFWLKNTGIFIPLIIGFLIWTLPYKRKYEKDKIKQAPKKTFLSSFNSSIYMLIFFLPFAFLFIFSNLVKLAPWEWDNIKVLIYWFIGAIPLATFALAHFWQKSKIFSFIAAACLAVMMFSGVLDVWRVASSQVELYVFDKDAIEIAKLIKKNTDPHSLFLNAPTHNSAIVLSGRPSFMRYTGHLSSHGIAYQERETDLKLIYSGHATADFLLKKHNIDYILISPEEITSLQVKSEFFQKFKIISKSGNYKVYEVK